MDSGERRNTVGVKVLVPALSAQRVLGLPSPGLKAAADKLPYVIIYDIRTYTRLFSPAWAAPASIAAQVHHDVVPLGFRLGLRLVPLVVVVRTGWARRRSEVAARAVVPAGLLIGRLGPLQLAHLVAAGVVAAGAGPLERVR